MTQAERELRQMATSPGTPFWVQSLITTALDKDCVDAASCLNVVAKLFNQRVDEVLGVWNQPQAKEEAWV